MNKISVLLALVLLTSLVNGQLNFLYGRKCLINSQCVRGEYCYFDSNSYQMYGYGYGYGYCRNLNSIGAFCYYNYECFSGFCYTNHCSPSPYYQNNQYNGVPSFPW